VGIRVEGVGYGQLDLDRWPDEPVEMRLSRSQTLSGTVTDMNGKALASCPVYVTRTAHTPNAGQPELPILVRATTDTHGRFDTAFIPPGTYSVFTEWHGNTERAAIVAVRGGLTNVPIKIRTR